MKSGFEIVLPLTNLDEPDNPQKVADDQPWKVDMFCRGIYNEDGLEYEGLIKSIENSDDGQYAVVQFIGYGNEETIWLQELMKSAGEEARQKQTKEALGEVPVDTIEPAEAVVDTKSTPTRTPTEGKF